MAADLDQHVGLGNVQAVVTNLWVTAAAAAAAA
jgi:hypothetical protein